VASLGYFAESYGTILSPDASDVLGIVVVVLAVPGELAFALWLAIKGVDEEKWNERALRAKRPVDWGLQRDGREGVPLPRGAGATSG
jgi:hypothetical protein